MKALRYQKYHIYLQMENGIIGFIFSAGEYRARIVMERFVIFTKTKLFIN